MKNFIFFFLWITSFSMASQNPITPLYFDEKEACFSEQKRVFPFDDKLKSPPTPIYNTKGGTRNWILKDIHGLFKHLTLKERNQMVYNLSLEQRRNVNNRVVQAYILEDRCSFFKGIGPQERWDTALGLTDTQRDNLCHQSIQTWILEDAKGLFTHLTLRQRWQKALMLTIDERWSLKSPIVRTWILEDAKGLFTHLTLGQRWQKALMLTVAQRGHLKSPAVQKWILEDENTFFEDLSLRERWEMALQLRRQQRENIENKVIQTWILKDTQGLFKDLSPRKRWEKALNLRCQQEENLKSPDVERWILQDKDGFFKKLTSAQKWKIALELTSSMLSNLSLKSVQRVVLKDIYKLFKDIPPRRRWEKAMGLTFVARENLKNKNILKALRHKILTFDQGIHLNQHHRRALTNPDTYDRLERGQLPVEVFLREAMDGPINTSQSTHTASVHKSVTDSIIRLRERYDKDLRPSEKTALLQRFRADLEATHHEHKEVALRCWDQLTTQLCGVKEKSSGVFMADLLVYVSRAVKDKTLLLGTVEDALQALIRGLYDIQRGYNLDDQGHDLGGLDARICAAGSFNKIIEILIGIHPDAKILFITNKTAQIKLPVVVREEALKYMNALGEDRQVLRDKMKNPQSQEEALEDLYGAITPAVRDRMLNEFESLYKSPEDTAFLKLLSYGRDALDPLTLINDGLSFSENSEIHGYVSTEDDNTQVQNLFESPGPLTFFCLSIK